MRKRLIIFIVATLLSTFGLLAPLVNMGAIMTQPVNIERFFVTGIFIVAWGFYFLISYYWVKYNRVKKSLKAVGLISGLSAILCLYPNLSLLAFVATSIILMIYVSIKVPSQ